MNRIAPRTGPDSEWLIVWSVDGQQQSAWYHGLTSFNALEAAREIIDHVNLRVGRDATGRFMRRDVPAMSAR